MKPNLLLFLSLFSMVSFAQQTRGDVERLDDEINLLIGEDAVVEILAEGFSWSEGPVWVPQLNAVLFTDVPENKLYRWDEKNGLSIYLDPSGYTGYAPNEKKAGGNGLILDPDGNLFIAQHGDRRIAKVMAPLDKPGAFTTVVDRFERQGEDPYCSLCGSDGHARGACPHTATCFNCGKRGHDARSCLERAYEC